MTIGLIDPHEYTQVVKSLREFFDSKSFLEVHTQNRLSILAACEDPTTVATYEYTQVVKSLREFFDSKSFQEVPVSYTHLRAHET